MRAWPAALQARPLASPELVMSVSRAADGGWQVVGDDGSLCEAGFASRGAAQRSLDDRADVSDRQVRALVKRCSPAQRRELRRLLDEIDVGVDAARAP